MFPKLIKKSIWVLVALIAVYLIIRFFSPASSQPEAELPIPLSQFFMMLGIIAVWSLGMWGLMRMLRKAKRAQEKNDDQ